MNMSHQAAGWDFLLVYVTPVHSYIESLKIKDLSNDNMGSFYGGS